MVQHNGTDEGTWQYKMKCSDVPVAIIIGSTVGAFFALCLVLLVSAIVIINVNDYRQYQNYLKNKEKNWKMLGENMSPLYKNPVQKTENPRFQNPTYRRRN